MHIFTKSIVMSLFLLVATAANGQITGELSLTNPGFETGDKSGWTEWSEGGGLHVEIVSDATHSGDHAAKISGETGSSIELGRAAGRFPANSPVWGNGGRRAHLGSW